MLMEWKDGQIFDDESFWNADAFLTDVGNARRHIMIKSGYISIKRASHLAKVFARVIHGGATACVVVQEPKEWHADPASLQPEALSRIKEIRTAICILEEAGVHVTLAPKVHYKLAMIDYRILWEGSLNILSHNDAKEHMRRFINKATIGEMQKKHFVDFCLPCASNKKSFTLSLKQPTESLVMLSKLFRKVRKDKKLSQRQLAKLCGVSQAKISQLERCCRNAMLSTVLKVAEVLEIHIVFVEEEMIPSVARVLRNACSV